MVLFLNESNMKIENYKTIETSMTMNKRKDNCKNGDQQQ